MHPVWRRCSSLKYSRYSRSSRLASRAPRRPRCYAPIYEMGSNAGEPDERGRVLRTHARSPEQQPEKPRDRQSKSERDQHVSDPALLARVVGNRPLSAARLLDGISGALSLRIRCLQYVARSSRSECQGAENRVPIADGRLRRERGGGGEGKLDYQAAWPRERPVACLPRRSSFRSSWRSPRVLTS